MIGVAFALVILGYTSAYVGIQNLGNGGKGPKFADAMGLSGVFTSSSSTSDSGGATIANTPNMTGQPPSQNQSPAQVITV